MLKSPPQKWFQAGCSSPFMRLAQRLTAPRAFCKTMSAWSVKTRRALSRHCKDVRVYGHTTTAIHDVSTSSPPPDLFLIEYTPPPSSQLPPAYLSIAPDYCPCCIAVELFAVATSRRLHSGANRGRDRVLHRGDSDQHLLVPFSDSRHGLRRGDPVRAVRGLPVRRDRARSQAKIHLHRR